MSSLGLVQGSVLFVDGWEESIDVLFVEPAGEYLIINGVSRENGASIKRLLNPRTVKASILVGNDRSPVVLPDPVILAKELRVSRKGIEEGKVVEIRDRLWRVDGLDPVSEVVRVSSISGLDSKHEFYVPVEEVRRAVHPPPYVGVVGNPGFQRMLLQSLRLDLMHSTAVLMGLQRSRVIPMPYQLVPVLMAMELPSARLLLADDVGLGKTVEAGLVVSELLGRRLAERVLFVVSANLREQWQEVLRRFFHINAEIISRRHLRQLERELLVGGDPWGHYPYLITSIDYVKQSHVLQRVLQQRWDVIVLDEAHNCAKPHQNVSASDPLMQRWLAAKALAENSKNLLLLTATPHNGYRDSFASLIEMLEPSAVSGVTPDVEIDRDLARRHICQRQRKDVKEWLEKTNAGINPFPDRDHKEEFVLPSSELREVIDAVNSISDHILDSVKSEGALERRVAKWTILHLHKRALSSPYALACSLRNRIQRIDDELKARSDKAVLGIREEDTRKSLWDFDQGEDLSEEEADMRTDRVLFGSIESYESEKKLLVSASDLCKRITASRDAKLYYLLRNALPAAVDRAEDKNAKIIVFTRYKDTLEYLQRELSKEIDVSLKLRGMGVYVIHGEMNPPRRREVFEAFKKAEKAILITTDCMAEGIDLQYSANQIIHYELPWNPNRLEQRNGRIDRFGQPKKMVYIRTLIIQDTLENAILELLMKKAAAIRDAYGFAPPFFGDDLAVLDAITDFRLEAKFGPQKSLFDFFETRMDRARETAKLVVDHLMDGEVVRMMREDSFYGQTNVNLDDVVKRMAETEASLGGRGEVERFVRGTLPHLGGRLEEIEPDVLRMVLPKELAERMCVEEESRITFDQRRGAADSELEMVDLGSSVVSGLIEQVKTLAYSPVGERYGRTAAVGSSLVDRVSAVFHVRMRYVAGGEAKSIIEEIVPLGVEVYDDRVLNDSTVGKLIGAQHEPHGLSSEQIKEALNEAIQHPRLLGLIEERAEANCARWVGERRVLRDRLERDGLAKGLEGYDKVTCASQDILTVTLYCPRRGGV